MRMSNLVAVETPAKARTLDDVAESSKTLAGSQTPLAVEEEGGVARETKADPKKKMMMMTDCGVGQHHSTGSSPEPKGLHSEEEEEEEEGDDGGGGGGAEDRDCDGTEEQTEKAEQEVKTPGKRLSRDSSQDYTDSTGIDLHDFLVNTLTNNPRDRITLLKLEQDLLDFISNIESQRRKFPPMTSYHRMLLHRVAAYFGMDHNVDPSGKSVVVNKTPSTRIPNQKFCDHIGDASFPERYVLKRDHRSFDREDAASLRMRLKSDMRSKSMEEQEEEYQRARDWIFEGDHLIFNSRGQDKETTGKSSHQRRQIFSRQRSGRSGAGWQSGVEAEACGRPGDGPPWSSTDSSDGSQRGAGPGGPGARAAGAGAVQRGDSTASSKSTGRLSETSSESSSSVVSFSLGPQPRPHNAAPPPAPPPPRPHPACAGGSHRHGNARGPKSEPLPAAEGPALASFYMLPLEIAAAGMMPGGVLLNMHTGQPILGPDGSVTVHATPGATANAGRGPQQRRHPVVQQVHMVARQQPANHLHAQADALGPHFGHMTLTVRQPPHPDGGCGVGVLQSPQDAPHHCPPPPQLPHHPSYHHPQPQGNPAHPLASYLVTGGLQPPQPPQNAASATPLYHHHQQQQQQQAYPGAGTPAPGGFQAVMSQSVLQQHGYVQPPVQQVNSYYCASMHYTPTANQQQPYQAPPGTPLTAYGCPPGQSLPQHQAYHASATLPSAAPDYQTAAAAGLQPISSQQTGVGNQMQSVMVQYPTVPTYQQVSMSHAPQAFPQHYPLQHHQQHHQQQQQPVMVSCQMTQGGGAVQPCYGLLPPGQQHTTMSSTVSFLPVQVVEPLQYQPAPPPSLPQHCTGVYPGAPAGGMVVMQLPAHPQQYQHHPPPPQAHAYQRKPPSYKLHAAEQHCPRRPPEVLQPRDDAQSSARPGCRATTPALSVLLGPPGAVQGPRLAPPTVPFLAHLHHPHTAITGAPTLQPSTPVEKVKPAAL